MERDSYTLFVRLGSLGLFGLDFSILPHDLLSIQSPLHTFFWVISFLFGSTTRFFTSCIGKWCEESMGASVFSSLRTVPALFFLGIIWLCAIDSALGEETSFYKSVSAINPSPSSVLLD